MKRDLNLTEGKTEILNWTLLYLRSTWNFPFKDECANLMSSSTLGIHGFVDLIFSIKITRIILSGNKKGSFVFTCSVIAAGGCCCLEHSQFQELFQAQPLCLGSVRSSLVAGSAMAVQAWGLVAVLGGLILATPQWQPGLWHPCRDVILLLWSSQCSTTRGCKQYPSAASSVEAGNSCVCSTPARLCVSTQL